MKLLMVDYVRDRIPHDNFDGGIATWVVWANVWLVTSLSVFSSFLFSFLRYAPRSHFLTDRDDLYARTRASSQRFVFWGLDNIRLHLGVKPPKKTP